MEVLEVGRLFAYQNVLTDEPDWPRYRRAFNRAGYWENLMGESWELVESEARIERLEAAYEAYQIQHAWPGMVVEHVSVDDVIDYLNDLIQIDKPAVAALVANRVPCNEAMAQHPTVQVAAQNDGFHVGLLGILNGMFGVDEAGWGPIMFVFEDGDLSHVRRTPKHDVEE
jgi:hypothetical protein